MYHNEYETVVILRPDLDEAETNSAIERLEGVIANNDGHLLERDEWGKRKLAYAIENHLKGHYVLLHHLSPPALIAEMERISRLEDAVIRFMTVKQAELVDVSMRVEQAREKQAAIEAEKAEKAEKAEADNASA